MSDRFEQIRLLEAILFASAEPLAPAQLARHLPEGVNVDELLQELAGLYGNRGVNLVPVGKAWAFRTAADLAPRMVLEQSSTRKLSRVAMETLAIIAYHQPVTRAEIEEIRGVSISKGTIDLLLEVGWIRPCGRRRTPGRPVTWGTTQAFLDHFGLTSLDDLPGVGELKAAGLLDARPALTALEARGQLLSLEEAMGEGLPGAEREDEADEADEAGIDEADAAEAWSEAFLEPTDPPDSPKGATGEEDGAGLLRS